ncbi:MAG TPA: hypothetical protein DIT64_13315 [Verrucomicrobiales bacterium]|nr:hypothetical protein [Verrucomicrobiales bacterium]
MCALALLGHMLAGAGLYFMLRKNRPEPVESVHQPWFQPADFLTPSWAAATPQADSPKAPAAPATSSPAPAAPETPTPPARPTAGSAPPVAKSDAAQPPAPQAPLQAAPPSPSPVPDTATAAAQPRQEAPAQRAPSRTIKLSPVRSGGPLEPSLRPVVTLMDIAKLKDNSTQGMDAVLVEMQGAFMDAWQPPEMTSANGRALSVVMRLLLRKDGTLGGTLLEKSSGRDALDASVLNAAAKVKKISTELPANFPEHGYDVEATFLIE